MIPSRIALLIVGVLVAAAVVFLVLDTDRTPSPTTTSAPSPQVRVGTPQQPSPSPTPTDFPSTSSPGAQSESPWTQTEAARQVWAPVAVGFAKHYTLASKPPDVATWRASLAPYGSDKVAAYLRTVSLDDVRTRAAYDGSYEVLKFDPDQVAVQITYNDGYALVLYIDVDQDRSRAAVVAFDELEQ